MVKRYRAKKKTRTDTGFQRRATSSLVLVLVVLLVVLSLFNLGIFYLQSPPGKPEPAVHSSISDSRSEVALRILPQESESVGDKTDG